MGKFRRAGNFLSGFPVHHTAPFDIFPDGKVSFVLPKTKTAFSPPFANRTVISACGFEFSG